MMEISEACKAWRDTANQMKDEGVWYDILIERGMNTISWHAEEGGDRGEVIYEPNDSRFDPLTAHEVFGLVCDEMADSDPVRYIRENEESCRLLLQDDCAHLADTLNEYAYTRGE